MNIHKKYYYFIFFNEIKYALLVGEFYRYSFFIKIKALWVAFGI